MQQATLCYNQGNFDEAERLYKKALEIAPNSPDIYNLLGLVAQNKGLDLVAVEYFYKALSFNPFLQEYNFSLAYSLENLGKYSEAIECYKKASSVKESYNNIGNIYQKMGEVEKAKESYQKALLINKDYDEPKINLLFIEKNINELMTFNHPLAHYYIALFLFEGGKNHKALSYLQENLEFDYQHALRGEILFAEKEYDEAKVFLKNAISINPNNYKAIKLLADIMVLQKDFVAAEDLYKKVLEAKPNNIDAQINYANMLYVAGNVAQALEEYRRAVLIDDKNFAVLNNLAVIIKETGDYQEALGLFFAAKNIEPENAYVDVNILESLVLLACDNFDDAKSISKNWLKHYPDNIYAKHLVARFEGKTADDEVFNQKFFDEFSDNYEAVLKKINYNLPNLVCEVFSDIKGRVLDLGCGSGLLGEKIKNAKNYLIGVDVSQKMLRLAKEKKCYDELSCIDAKSYLQSNNDFDYVFALDVFCYLSDLSDIVNALKNKKFLFSVEKGGGKDFELQINGRYKHSLQYIKSLLGDLSYEIKEVVLRVEDGKDVRGLVFYKK